MTLSQQVILTANALDDIVRKCRDGWGAEDASPVVLEALSGHAKDLREAAHEINSADNEHQAKGKR